MTAGPPTPAGPAEVAAAPDRTGRRVVALFGPYRRRVAVVAVTILLSSLLGIALPFLTQAIFDRALFPRTAEGSVGQPRIGLLLVLVAASIGVTLLTALLGVAQTWLATRLGNAVMRDLRDRLFAHLQRMELAFFTSTRTGEIQSRLGNDVAGVQSVVTDTASSILGNTVTVVSALVAMLVLSWRLTLVAVVLLPAFVLLQIRVGRVRRRVAGATQRSVADMTAITQETLSVSGVLLAKVFDRQQTEVERYSAENARQAELQVRQTMTGQSFFATVQAFFGLTPALVYLVAGLSIGGVFLAGGADTLTAGTIVAFTTLQTRLLFPVVQLLRVGVDVQTSLALFERIFEYLDLQPAIVERPGALDLAERDVAGHVRFEDVRFRYDSGDRAGADGTQPWTLDGVSLDVPAGSLVAFVGPSGAGKTTAAYLVPRLYDVDAGRVTLDGHDVRDLTRASLARAIGVVTQESYLFHASVRDNLRYGRPDATDAQIEAAARAANIHDRIERLADGYGTTVGERGYRLSGGEKQRLAIARVLLADPRVLILDEATSALDTASERLVQQALEQAMRGRTTIAIAHRLSTVLAADAIFVFDRGRVVERGAHAELMAQGGLYARLYAEQFGGGTVEARCEDGVVFADGDVVRHAPTREDAPPRDRGGPHRPLRPVIPA
ncbi:ATP-binding cassette, subfamily B [Geodermatophilus pulveris]|uniref:Fatty acid ABC transporter ATP-binding/permease protein n=1 Tax=Geodermatophilus pulveris TaxID=1564159 RepID=A0A239IS69_9ACTN|nr:ABC transporter ATP-binding protein [Geodermatophilus pulveris]SNS96232.1 ATP-binding cassette, subfamily B [Geodermatophilus pulveris]